MRTFFAFAYLVAVSAALGGWYRSRMSQKQIVKQLTSLSSSAEESSRPDWTKICVFYDRSLEWREYEGRYAWGPEPTGIHAWLAGKDQRDLLESPIAIQIICDDYRETGLADDIVEEIRKLPSVKQIWLQDHVGQNDASLNREIEREIGKLFPDLIIEPPYSMSSKHRCNRRITK